MRTTRKNLRIFSLTGLVFLMVLALSGSAMAQGSIFGTVTNTDLTTPANGEISFYGFLDDTDEEIRIEASAGAGYDAGNWFDDFQNYLTEGPGNPYDYYFYNVVNGEAFHLENPIPNNGFQQENIQLASAGWPAAPVGLTGSPVSASAIVVRWNAVPGLTYHVYRRVQPSTSSFFRLDDPTGSLLSPGTADSFYVDLTSDGVSSYDYLIIAQDGAGNLSPHSPVVTVVAGSVAAPVLASIDPSNGSALGGTLVNVYGSGFDPAGVSVQFGASLPVAGTVVSPFHLTVLTPAAVPSVVDLVMNNLASAQSSNSLTAAFTYDANSLPILAAIGPQGTTEGLVLNFGTTASDVDGDNPIMTSSALPGTATYLDNGDGTGTFNWATSFVDAGVYPVTFYATDLIDGALIDSELVVVTITEAGNQTPAFALVNDTSVAEGASLQLILSATDADATTPVLSVLGLPINATFLDNADGTGTFNFSPDFTQEGVYPLIFIADDGSAADSMTIQITVVGSNLAPAFVAQADTTMNETETLTLIVSATDPDGTIPSLSAFNLPVTNAAFVDNADGTGTLTFTPDFSQAGAHAISFVAADGTLADTIVVTVTVNDGGNQAPIVALMPDTTIAEGDSLLLTILAADPDGTFPALSMTGLPANALFSDSADGSGLFEFYPDFTQSGVYPLTVIADDGLLADTILFTVTVTDIGNLVPQFAALADTTVDENGLLTLTISATDPDAGVGVFPSLSVNSQLNNFTFVDNGDGTALFNYTPDYYDAGVVAVSFFATDQGLPVQTAVATINVTTVDVNQAPIIDSLGPFGVTLGDTLIFTVTASDSTDPDTGSVLLLSIQAPPNNSSFVDNGDNSGTFTFYPDSSQLVPQVITFLAVDQDAAPLAATMDVNIDVVVVNSLPLLAGLADAYITDEGSNLLVLFSASDPDGGIPSLLVDNLPNNSSFTDNGDGTGLFSFTPDFIQGGGTGNNELYYVTFKAFDSFGYSKKNVLIQVVDAGDQAPVFDLVPQDSTVEGTSLVVTIIASDPDGLPVTLTAIDSTLPPNASFVDNGDGSGDINFSPDFTQAGIYDILIVVDDGTLTDTAIVRLTAIEAGNQPPTMNAVADQTVGELHDLNFAVSASDLDGDFPLLSAAPLPGTATFTDNLDGSGVFDWVPSTADSGTYAIWFYAEDAAVPGLFDSLEMFVTVVDTNRAPRGNEFRVGFPDTLWEGDTLRWRVFGYDLDGTPPNIIARLDGEDSLGTNMTFNFPVITGDTVFGELVFAPDYTQGGPNPGVPYNVRFFLIDAFDTNLVTPVPIAPLTWFVWNRNQPPQFRFVPDSVGPFSIAEGDSLIFSVIGIDPDGPVKPSLSASGFPQNAFVSGSSDSLEFRFYPDFTQSGSYTVQFVVTDIGGAVDTQMVDIGVLDAGNQSPFFFNQLSDTTMVPVNTGITLWLRSADPDLDSVTISMAAPVPNSLFADSGNGSALFIFTPAQIDVGNFYDVSFLVSDLSGVTDTLSTTLSVVSFLRGDLDLNSKYTMNDLAFLIGYLYREGESPLIEAAADVNGDTFINLLDVTYLIRFLYISGPEPPRL